MSTAAIYNGFGQYETNETGAKGISLTYGGVPFWFPFQEITYIPDYTMREVDHAASTADNEAESFLTYKTFRVSGLRIAEELLETQIPVKNSEKGMVLLDLATGRKRGNDYQKVLAGVSEDGSYLFADIQEITPTADEKAKADTLAKSYKERTVQEYFQSKRERMAGGHGQVFPTGLVKIFMDELGLKDIDDISRQQQAPIDLEAFARFLRAEAANATAAPAAIVQGKKNSAAAANLI